MRTVTSQNGQKSGFGRWLDQCWQDHRKKQCFNSIQQRCAVDAAPTRTCIPARDRDISRSPSVAVASTIRDIAKHISGTKLVDRRVQISYRIAQGSIDQSHKPSIKRSGFTGAPDPADPRTMNKNFVAIGIAGDIWNASAPMAVVYRYGHIRVQLPIRSGEDVADAA